MNHGRTLGALTAALVAALLLGCAGMPRPGSEGARAGAGADTGAGASQAAAPLPIRSEYDLSTLRRAVLSYQQLVMSYDYFGQFLWGDGIFADYLYRIFASEPAPYAVGQGTVLTVRREGQQFLRLERALVEVKPDGSRWWQVRQAMQNGTIEYAVLVHPFGVPLRIRYRNPQDGQAHERVPFLAERFREALAETPAEVLEKAVAQDVARQLERSSGGTFENPQIVGEEAVEVPAGAFQAVHVRDLPGSGTVQADYWLSPDVPGGILKLEMGHPGEPPELQGVLSRLTRDNRLELTEGELTPEPPGMASGGVYVDEGGEGGPAGPASSEGSPQDPVSLAAGDSHYGSVGPGGVSYYRIEVPRRGDITAEVSELAGDAELYFYGSDSTFQDWSNASSGSTLDFQDYLVDPGAVLYFTVVDVPEGETEGESYRIDVRESFVLDRTGILIRGDIYTEARELPLGGTVEDSLREGLNYYSVTVPNGPTLQVVAEGLPAGVELSWFDVRDGSYSGMYGSDHEGRSEMEIKGLQPGTECYFYVSGDSEAVGPSDTFRITARELPE